VPTPKRGRGRAGSKGRAADGARGGNGFKGQIKVASRIVDYLSSGLYESPAACMKELVNNSFDADATHVDVFVKPDADRIIVSDDGSGMSQQEFQEHFDHVSESHKRDGGDLTAMGRPKVGRIGIGFIAANELCDIMEIVSTKRGSTELMRVVIDFKRMRDPIDERRSDGEITKGDYRGTIGVAPRGDHYTRIYLNEVRDNVRDVMMGAEPDAHTAGEGSLYGYNPDSISRRLADPYRRTWTDLNLYSQTMLEVGLNVPVRYAPNWMPSQLRRRLKRLEETVDALDFTLKWDGTEVRKPVVLGHDGDKHPQMLRRFKFEGEHVSAEGYFFAQHGVLLPQELNGLLIRIRNAAVGDFDSSFLGFRSSEYTILQRWVSGEIWASDELEEALNIDRRTLRVTHPAFIELQAAVHRELSKVFREVRRKLYDQPSAAKKQGRAQEQRDQIDQIAARHRLSTARRGAKPSVEEETTSAATRAMVRKYTVSELFDLALEVAEQELPRSQFRKFAQALAKRLTR
jgi:Histidine kinase-, DNA gyrase B-, and HSP90-like ATPase